MSSQYSPLTQSGRSYIRQKVKQTLKGIVCSIFGHDTEPKIGRGGQIKAQVVSHESGEHLYRCHRCFEHVPKRVE